MAEQTEKYNHREIEPKWQKKWEEAGIYRAMDFDKKPKKYILFEFPYPSGDRLHVGHGRSYTALDAMARKARMQGFNTLLPMGWDAFGLPAENYAVKTGINPNITTKENISHAKEQAKRWGLSIDWDREINTTDPGYYRWTQWIFLQLYKHNLAYWAEAPVNWCSSCKSILANEEVLSDGTHERCGKPTEKRMQKQWVLKITEYADRLLEDLKEVDYLPKIALQQINWIGKSEGAEIQFKINIPLGMALRGGYDPKTKITWHGTNDIIKVFTTRPDTLYGATFIVISPEYWLAQVILENKEYLRDEKGEVSSDWGAIKKYVEDAKKKTELERTELTKEKTGVFSGLYAINPVTGKEIPIWISDFVLSSYGTGAIMAVPAHDQRDFEFAQKYGLPIKEVVIPKTIDKHDPPKDGVKTVFRKAVQVILLDPKTKKVLCLKWKKFPWTTFITGGLEGEEDIISGAKREVLEETGYMNIKYLKTLGGPVESHFYANHKGENRKAIFNALVFELENDEKISVTDEENQIHEAVWMSWEEIKDDKNVKCSEYEIWLDRFFNPEHAYGEPGILINSEIYDGLTSEDASKKIITWLDEKKIGKKTISYHLRDWIFSRQHYWGEPIPIIHCEKCGIVPVPEEDLPVELPYVEKYQPTETGESPLAKIKEWVNVACPECGGPGRRETDTMPNWAGSNWYYVAYVFGQKLQNQKLEGNIFIENKDLLKYWLPVDLYNGGMEHTTLHLLYSRFIYKFLFDIGAVPTKEPYSRRRSHGMVLGPDGQKMSKSLGNVINPDEVIEAFGADTFRLYESFIGPFDQMVAWSEESVEGCYRFLKRVWILANSLSSTDYSLKSGSQKAVDNKPLIRKLNQTIKKVGEDIEAMKFNTAVAAMMEFLNEVGGEKCEVGKDTLEKFLLILAPFAPFITEELWQRLGNKFSIHQQQWPAYDPGLIEDEMVTIAVQVNGKLRGTIKDQRSKIKDQNEVEEAAKRDQKVKKYLEGKTIKKTIFIQGKLINFVV